MTKNLQQMILEIVQDTFTLEKVISIILFRKLKEAGFDLTEENLKEIEEQLNVSLSEFLSSSSDEFNFQVDIDNIDIGKRFEIDFDDSDIEWVDKKIESMTKVIAKEAVESLGELWYFSWKKDITKELSPLRDKHKKFMENLRNNWGIALDSLDALFNICRSIAGDFNEKYRNETEDEDLTFEALSRLHARGSQVSFEVLVLLENGFADGAQARWRTLYEIAVISGFIRENGLEVAKRYLLHEHVVAYKNAKQFINQETEIDIDIESQKKLKRIEEQYQILKEMYGKDYVKGDYGWAAEALGIKQPNFTHLEKTMNLDHFRSYVRDANHNVHASSHGILNRLGIYRETGNLLAGSSMLGLGEPARNSAHSMRYITSNFLLYKLDLDNLAITQALEKFIQDVYEYVNEAEILLMERMFE